MSTAERKLLCPGCSQMIPVPSSARPGDLIECANCAGVKFRLCAEDGREFLKLVQLVACPVCGESIPVDDDTLEGTLIAHDSRRFALSREFGAFSLEAVESLP